MRCEVFINMFAFKVPAVSAALLVDASFQPDEREANAPRYKTWIHTRTGPYVRVTIQPAETRTTVRAQSPYMTYMVMDTLGPNKKIYVPSFRPLRASSFWRLFCKVAVLWEGSAQNSSWEPTCTSIQALLWYQDILRAAKVLSGRLVHFMLFCTEQPNALWLLKT